MIGDVTFEFRTGCLGQFAFFEFVEEGERAHRVLASEEPLVVLSQF